MLWWIFLSIATTLIVGSTAILRFNFKIVTVSGNSMYPTLSPGERLLARKVWQPNQLKPGQIVIGRMETLPQPPDLSQGFSALEKMDLPVIDLTPENHSPDEHPPDEHHIQKNIQNQREPANFIKRIIGLPGDRIEVNIKDLHEIMQTMLKSISNCSDTLNWTIPATHCFLRGDGLVSMDSLVLGPVPLDAIDSVVIAKLPRSAKQSGDTGDITLHSDFHTTSHSYTTPVESIPSGARN